MKMTYTEKNIKEVTDELWELIPKDFNYKNIDRKTLYNWLKSRLEYSIHQARAEERERVVGEIRNTPIDKAHTYSSENADEYRIFDNGQESYKQKLLTSLQDNPK